jgi:hypothetical protein
LLIPDIGQTPNSRHSGAARAMRGQNPESVSCLLQNRFRVSSPMKPATFPE